MSDWTVVNDTQLALSMDTPLHQVDSLTWIGDIQSRRHVEDKGITQVICITTTTLENALTDLSPHVEEKRFYLSDSPQSSFDYLHKLLDETTQLITDAHAQGKIILVHCMGGISRSATVILDYLMKSKEWPFLTAFEYLCSKRYCVQPNPSFYRCLQEREARYVTGMNKQ